MTASRQAKDSVSLLQVVRQLLGSGDLRRVLPLILTGSFFANLLALAMPLAILQILDRVVKNQAIDTLVFIAIGVIIALALSEVLNAANGALTSWLGARFEHRTILSSIEHLFKMPLREYSRSEPGAYAEKLQATSQVSAFYSGKALLVIFDLPFIVLYLVLIYLIGGWLVWVPVTLLALFGLLILLFGRAIGNQMKVRHTSDDRRFGFLYEVLAGIHSVKTMMIERQMERRYERLKEANAAQTEDLARSSNIANGLGTLFTQTMTVLVIFAGSLVVLEGAMTPGSLAACMMLAVRSMAPLRQGLMLWVRYQEFLAAQQRLQELMDLPITDTSNLVELPPIQQGVELKHIRLDFGGKREIFADLNLKVGANECIAIRGDSGSGKSLMLSLLAGLESPDAGEVLVDGRPLQEFLPTSVHKRIALLQQTGVLVSGTILQNLTMFDDSLNDQAMAAAHAMGLDRIVAGMKLGYETKLGENSQSSFPDGVRQLITIVRTLVRDPEVILFDEANIALDMDADRILRDYLAQKKGKACMILVTPRPSLINLADRVYSLEGGRLIENPPRQEFSDFNGEIPPRPEHAPDVDYIIQERFERPTDLSLCLGPMLKQLGWRARPRELAESIPHLEFQLNLPGFVSVMSNCGFQPRSLGQLKAPPDPRLFPCLYLPENAPAQVILAPAEAGKLRVVDGASGEEREIEPPSTPAEYYVFKQMEDSGKAAGSWILRQLWRFRLHLGLILGVTFFHAVLSLSPPLFVKSVYEWVLPAQDMVVGLYLLGGVAIAIGLGWFLALLRSRMLAFIAGRFEYILGVEVFQRIINLPAASVEGVSVSHQINRIHTLERLRDFFLGPFASLAFELPGILVFVLALVIINPWLLIVIAISAAVYYAIARMMQGLDAHRTRLTDKDPVSRWEFINETLNAMPTIRTAGAENTWLARLRDISGRTSIDNFQENFFNIRYGAYAQFIGSITGLAGMIVSALLMMNGMITSGVLVASNILIWRLIAPIMNMYSAASTLPQLKTNVRQLDNLMRLAGEHAGGVRQSIRPAIQGSVNLSRVSFRYAADADPVLLGLNLNVPAQKMLAITGPDGAGKSTLLKMILRVYSPQAGTVRLDGIDIRQMNTADVRAQISYMPQQFHVFYGTVSQNLRLVHPAATDEEIRWAAEMAGLLEDIQALPEGFETRISNSRSAQLPNGFRQRLSLARTILKPASVVLMDEPGTGMDQAGDEALVRCLSWLRGRATVILISPRPGHLRLADNVVLMQRGGIAAMGSFDEIKDSIMKGMG
ncbi:MAG: ATP-binding cassette domain-containing protein [Gammaproteobacteria bacterium]|nr:ATP-binding cassette domain-containing protein [Gammaproteobacteria bacterium]